MTDIEKIIKGLECHRIDDNHRINCSDCPYYIDDDNHIRCVNDVHNDAVVLIKRQRQMYWNLEHDWRMLREKLSTQTNAQKSALDVR